MDKMEKQTEKPLVGIAVPVYNTDKYLAECLEHILAQTYQNWVCYITDNASTDRSYEIALEYGKKDSRFKVFRNESTVSAFKNWNITLGRLAGLDVKYVKYECADDWMFPQCIEKMVQLHEKDEQIGAVYAYRLEDKYVNCDGLDIYDGNVYDGKEIIRKSLLHGLYIYGGLGQALYKTEALKQVDANLQVINENNIHCDVEMNDNVLRNSKAGFIHEVLTYYRRHEGQVLSFAEKTNTLLYGIERRMFLFMDIYPELQQPYRELRLEYAIFLNKCKRKKESEILAWHEKHLERPITKNELKLAKKQMRKRFLREIRVNIVRLFTV